MGKRSKRKFVDWDSIEPFYRAGILPLSGICAQYMADHFHSQTWKTTVSHVAIIKKAKEKHWQRNLVEKIQKRIKVKLVTGLVTGPNQRYKLSDFDIIEQASDAGSKVVLRHQEEIKDLVIHEERLLLELETASKIFITQYKGGIVKEAVAMTVKERASTLKDLAAVRAQRIALERQAHGLDDKVKVDDVDGLVVEFIGAGH